jgi:hypothetical protein
MSLTGKVAGADPEAFTIIDGKLYLNWDNRSAAKFESGAAENIQSADANWEKLIRAR